jgi:hypothetical protein
VKAQKGEPEGKRGGQRRVLPRTYTLGSSGRARVWIWKWPSRRRIGREELESRSCSSSTTPAVDGRDGSNACAQAEPNTADLSESRASEHAYSLPAPHRSQARAKSSIRISSQEAPKQEDVRHAAAGLEVEPFEHDLLPPFRPRRERPDRDA